MHSTFGKLNSIETCFCSAIDVWRVVVPNLSHTASMCASFVTFVLPHFYVLANFLPINSLRFAPSFRRRQ